MSQPRPPALPLIVLGLMTVLTLAGPFGIVLAIRGGGSPEWPPDRPVEWWVFGVIVGVFVILMAACLGLGLAQRRQARTSPRAGADERR